MTQKWENVQKFPIFLRFNAIFVKFSVNSWVRKLKTLNMAVIRCPVGFSKEMNAVLQMKNSQIDTEKDKNSKFFRFSLFLFNF